MSDTDAPAHPASSASASGGYEVMARRYRPKNFDQLVGQEFLVRVMRNAFERGRIPHAIMLTGVRGVGKTTTARIVAKGLNCGAVDAPTIAPCGVCANCQAIAASRHVDVLEMDAASRTGIDDVREIIDSVAYRAAEARYKVYIIDEVHMLSKNAFNGLLKTLEEPPSHVVFILATTNIEKVPVTVLSRCMRFDLRRVEPDVLIDHLAAICDKEGAAATREALAVIARASEGSVRDALSLLDQAVAHSGADGLSETTAREMLGLADRSAIFTLFDQIMTGDAAGALRSLAEMRASGADAAAVLADLGDVCHLATMAKALPERADAPDLTALEREKIAAAAQAYGVRALGRLWQMVLKALEEVAIAPSAFAAVEMALIRMTHVAALPTPEEITRRLTEGAPPAGPPRGPAAPGPQQNSAPPPVSSAPAGDGGPPPATASAPPQLAASGDARAAQPAWTPPPPAPAAQPPAPAPAQTPQDAGPASFAEMVALARKMRDGKLLVALETYVRPGPVRPGAFEFTPTQGAPDDLASELARKLGVWTKRRWMVSIADGHETQTIAERRAAEADALRKQALAHPLILAAMAAFPGVEISDLREAPRGGAPVDGGFGGDGDDAVLDDGDPFDDEGDRF